MNAFALPSRFVHPPVVQLLNGPSGGKIYRLAEPLDYVTSVLTYPLIHIPAGFEAEAARLHVDNERLAALAREGTE